MNPIKILFRDKDLRNKILISLLLLLIFRIISHIPIPWINKEALQLLSTSGVLSFANLFSGGALQNYTIMATGISAYISASIVVQILTFVSPKLHTISKEAGGEKRIKKLTIYLGVLSAILSSFVTTSALEKTYGLLTSDKWYVYVVIAALHAIGTGIAIFIGETITEKGFGNGVSLLIFINIVTSFPSQIETIIAMLRNKMTTPLTVFVCIIVVLITITLVTLSETSEHRLKIQYSQSAIRGQSFNNQGQSFFPIKVNIAGVMPVIFASYVLQGLSIIMNLVDNETVTKIITGFLTHGSATYCIFMLVSILGFSYIYNWLSFDTSDISKRIQERGGGIPGIRPGKPTKEYIDRIKYDLTFIGAVYLAIITIIPMLIFNYLGLTLIASTSLIIMVGVSIETVNALSVEIKLRTRKSF